MLTKDAKKHIDGLLNFRVKLWFSVEVWEIHLQPFVSYETNEVKWWGLTLNSFRETRMPALKKVAAPSYWLYIPWFKRSNKEQSKKHFTRQILKIFFVWRFFMFQLSALSYNIAELLEWILFKNCPLHLDFILPTHAFLTTVCTYLNSGGQYSPFLLSNFSY